MDIELQLLYLICLRRPGFRNLDSIFPNNPIFSEPIQDIIDNAPNEYYGMPITAESIRDIIVDILHYKAYLKGKKNGQSLTKDLYANAKAWKDAK